MPAPAAAPAPAPAPVWARRTWLVALPLGLIIIAAFLPALENGFVDWDDDLNFLKNPYYRGLGWAQLKWDWTAFWVGVYQPVAWMILGAQSLIWQLDPRGYHLTSLLLHTANAVVLYVLTVTVLIRCRPESCRRDPWTCALAAGLASALFAVHPLRVEVVAWASCQPYLPCALFAMLAVLAYLQAFPSGPSPRWGWLAASFVLFALALLSKAPAVSLPAVLLIQDVYPLRRLGGGPGRWFGPSARTVWWEKVPFVLLSLVFIGLAIRARKHALSLVPVQQEDILPRIAQACYGIWFYLVETVLPLRIRAYYPAPRPINWLEAPFLLSILGTLALSVGLFLLRRRWPGLLAAWLSYLVILAPNTGLVRISDQIAADRYSYMALLGGVMVAAAGLCRLPLPSRQARPAALGMLAVSLGALLGLSVLTWHQCRTWHDTEALWIHDLNHEPSRPTKAHNGLGTARFRQGKFADARDHFVQAVRRDPSDPEGYNNLAMLLAACPDPQYRDGQRAVEFATLACKLTAWESPYILDTLAAAYAEAGDFDAAVLWQSRAIENLRDDEWRKIDYHTRLLHYQAQQPYREPSRGRSPTEVPLEPGRGNPRPESPDQ